jgi:hypothetical protein
MKIESKDTDIDSLLTGYYFTIPRFQRPYSWDAENINELWEDVISQVSNDYFIGSMVVFTKTKQTLAVVDGQQRLTTITILLCCLRDAYDSIGETDLADGLHLLIEKKNRSNKNEYVLTPETSFPYFQEYIQKFREEPDAKKKGIKEEDLLKSANTAFQKKFNGILDSIDSDPSIPEEDKVETKKQKLTEIREKVLNLSVILVKLDNEDDAYIIFETLNARGKDLELTDLVKNLFSRHLKAKGPVDHAKLRWEGILSTIHESSEDISPDTFIYHYWASRYESVPKKKLFPKFKKSVTKLKAKNYLKELESDSILYRSLYEKSFNWKKSQQALADSLHAIHQVFKLSQPTPATLSLVRAYDSKIISAKNLKDALVSIEKFHFVFTAVTNSRSSGGISAMYSSFAQKLYKCSDNASALKEIIALQSKLKLRIPSEEEFKVAFKEIQFSKGNTKQKALVRYILRKFADQQKLAYQSDTDSLTIEHYYPQSKADNIWTIDIVGNIGNLFLLEPTYNSFIGDQLPAKKLAYFNSNASAAIPDFIKQNTTWTPAAVALRAEEMSNLAYNTIWKI